MSADEFEVARRMLALLSNADALLVTAGAGMGVDSGLPDFRGDDGFWEAYPILGEAGIRFQDIANAQSFRDEPDLAWGFYGHRLTLYRKTIPHPGFQILKEIGEAMPCGYFVYTSNVDGQFQRAGFDADRVCEVHGSIHSLQCLDGCEGRVWSAADFIPQVDERRCCLIGAPPTCPVCGGIARPNILMFWDNTWNPRRKYEAYSDFQAWSRPVRNLVTIEIGAGTAIPTVRRFSESQRGTLIRINTRDAALPDGKVGIGIQSGALPVLARVAELYRQQR